jgi:hypothetical protein
MKGRNVMRNAEWILCPVCGNKTRNRIRETEAGICSNPMMGAPYDALWKELAIFVPILRHLEIR